MSKKSGKKSDLLTGKDDEIKDKIYISKQIDTSIAILDSPETDIVLEALLFLSKYGDIKPENLQYLQLHGIIPKVLKLFNRNVCILRVALRLLGILLRIDETVFEMDQDLYNDKIIEIANLYISHSDQYIKDFCIPILNRLATSCRITCLIFNVDLFTPIFDTLGKSDNNDLIEHTFKLFYVLLNAPSVLTVLPDVKGFKVDILMRYIEHPKLEISNIVMEIIRKLCYYQVEAIQKLFRAEKIVEKMFSILMDSEKYFHHKKALSILVYCGKSEVTSSYFVESLEFIKFSQWVKTCDPEYLPDLANIYFQLTQMSEIRQLLFDLSIEDSILYFLRSTEKEVLNFACMAISNMSTHKYCCERMLTASVVRELLNILQRKDTNVDPNNEIALKTIHDFFKRNYIQAVLLVYNLGGYEVILDFLKKGSPPLSMKSFLRVIELINMFVVHPEYKHTVLNEDLYIKIIHYLQTPDSDIASRICEILMNATTIDEFRTYFLKYNGPEVIISILKNTRCCKLFKNLLVFLHSMLIYKDVSEEFLHQKLLVVLNEVPEKLKIEVPIITRILNLLYNLYLPIKFFEKKKLEMTDKIKNRFYIIVGEWRTYFPFLEVLEKMMLCTLKTIYVIDYSYNDLALAESISSFSETSISQTSKTTDLSYELMSAQNINFGAISPDPFLHRYIQHFQHYILDTICISHKVKLLAEYIDILLCGPEENCTLAQKFHTFQLHIESLKTKLGNNVIPIGYLRLGFHCERALLFKAIADKVHIPTSLVKGSNKIYWNEVPIMENEEILCPGDTQSGKINFFVVDLMSDIGKLLPVGSREANSYCDIPF